MTTRKQPTPSTRFDHHSYRTFRMAQAEIQRVQIDNGRFMTVLEGARDTVQAASAALTLQVAPEPEPTPAALRAASQFAALDHDLLVALRKLTPEMRDTIKTLVLNQVTDVDAAAVAPAVAAPAPRARARRSRRRDALRLVASLGPYASMVAFLDLVL